MTFKMEWFGEKVLEATNSVCAKVSKEVAENIMEDAKKILKKNSSTDYGTKKNAYGYGIDGLVSQFYIEPSKFKNGGYLAWCQGPKNWKPPYHASFVEMGTFKDMAQPFMRPAAKKNKRKANQMYQDAVDKI